MWSSCCDKLATAVVLPTVAAAGALYAFDQHLCFKSRQVQSVACLPTTSNVTAVAAGAMVRAQAAPVLQDAAGT
jgi:hypothetical protein